MTDFRERLGRLRSRLYGRSWVLARRVLAAALFLTAAGLAAVPGAEGRAREPVLVTTHDLPLGSVLRPADVRVVERPVGFRPLGALTSPDQVEGRRLVGLARKGEPLTDVRLAKAEDGTPGRTTVPVRLADAGIAELLLPGTPVDVVAAGSEPGEAVVSVSDATVVTVVASSPEESGPFTARDAPLVMVSVPDDAASRLAAAALGQPVTVTLR